MDEDIVTAPPCLSGATVRGVTFSFRGLHGGALQTLGEQQGDTAGARVKAFTQEESQSTAQALLGGHG